MAAVEAAGYRTKTYRDICEPDGYLAGADAARAAELNQALADPETAAVFAARGGYGVVRLLDSIDYAGIAGSPKVVAGYSDITALHAALMARCGWIGFHSPNAIDLAPESGDAQSIGRFWSVVSSRDASPTLVASEGCGSIRPLAPGVARGPIVGGNLAVLVGLIGSPFDTLTEGAILLIEDVGEAPYRIDRMLAQLSLAGKLRQLAGVAVGHMTELGEGGPLQLEALYQRYLVPLGVPILTGLPVGHASPNLTVPLGAEVELDADHGRLSLIDACVI